MTSMLLSIHDLLGLHGSKQQGIERLHGSKHQGIEKSLEFPSSHILGIFLWVSFSCFYLFGEPNSTLLRTCILEECNSYSEKFYQSNRNHIVCFLHFKAMLESKCDASSGSLNNVSKHIIMLVLMIWLIGKLFLVCKNKDCACNIMYITNAQTTRDHKCSYLLSGAWLC